MWIILGLIAVAFRILYTRSTDIIVVNPLQGRRQSPPPGAEPEDDESEPQSVPDFARLLNTIQQAAQPASAQGRAAIIQMVQNNQFIEAMQLYRRLYGVDLATAKKAIDKMMLER
ncbi:MAG: hypothetical protein PHS14_05220 [Elusimicrobia bacterium]|nr:hypothetical protein [Elusimicrobiota bacterium]